MIYTATFSSKGQLTLPAALRRTHGIKSGQKVRIIKTDPKQGRIILQLDNELKIVEQLAGSLHRPGTKFVPYQVAREQAGKLLGKKYGLKKNLQNI